MLVRSTRAAEQAPWRDTVRRVVIQVSDYLDFDGKYLPGGRQRHVLDLAKLVRDEWKRDVVIVQKGRRAFEATCPDGLPVVGLKADTTSKGDPWFGFTSRRFLKPGDGMLYAAGEGAWPFGAPGSKGVQHGIWWDGPFSRSQLLVQDQRVLDFVRASRSVLCVDTNFINWLRGFGAEGLELCQKCVYVPNYADTERIVVTEPDRGPHTPLRIVFARRYEVKRGFGLLLDALQILKREGLVFDTRLYTIGGVQALSKELVERGLEDVVTVSEESLGSILSKYADADVAVVPTIWSEGTSLACVEAICAGLPVVVTPVGGLGNLVIPEFNGFVVAPDPRQIADALLALRDETLYRTMRRNCLSLRPAFSLARWKRQVREWLES